MTEVCKMNSLNTPVLLLVFNRPDTTSQVLDAIRQAKPRRLYVAGDGARDGKYGEVELVAKTREIAVSVDWPCEVKTLFREKNLGCKVAISSAITWFFENEEEGIILEDDCLPSLSFFYFCEELLEKYRYRSDIFTISGRNDLGEWKSEDASYFFTAGNIWGWATWKRAWVNFSLIPEDFAANKSTHTSIKWFSRHCPELSAALIKGCEKSINGAVSSWAYPWAYQRVANRSLNVVPSKNLIANIGFGESATHTLSGVDKIIASNIEFPLRHPKEPFGLDFDYINLSHHKSKPKLLDRAFRRLKKLLKLFLTK